MKLLFSYQAMSHKLIQLKDIFYLTMHQISWITRCYKNCAPDVSASHYSKCIITLLEKETDDLGCQVQIESLNLLNLEKPPKVSWLWVSPVQNLRKTPPKGHVYSSMGLGFIVWNTMLGLPGANPRHQTAGWVCPWLAKCQSAGMLSGYRHRL